MRSHLRRLFSRKSGKAEAPTTPSTTRGEPTTQASDSGSEEPIPNLRHKAEIPDSHRTDEGNSNVEVYQQGIEESQLGLKELVSQPSTNRNGVDIIAIHGLNGHREKTWTDKSTGVNWLSDHLCLPKDIPNARVLSFGYNSTTYFSRSDGNVRDFASELLAAIKASRRSLSERKRPLVFLCHSLGGLVFKQAVIRAHEQDNFYGPLLNKIQGVVFFGTPHRGSELAFWDTLGTRVIQAATIGYTTNSQLSRDLRVDSEMLQHISESFAYRGGDYKIRSFYETEFMPGLKSRVVEKDSARLGWKNELDIASSANHRTICKFPSANSPRYRTAISEIIEVLGIDGDSAEHSLNDAEEAFMAQLNCDYEHHLGQVDDPVPGTCSWILSHSKWQQWYSSPGSSLLWVTANPGCGKSTIAKFLIQHFQSQRKVFAAPEPGYFFFADGVSGQDNPSSALSALLHQLFRCQNHLIKHAVKRFEGLRGHAMSRFETLWSTLVDCLNDDEAEDLLWIIDGLDECDADTLLQFMKAFSAFFESRDTVTENESICNFKVIFLSRPTSVIQQVLGLSTDMDSSELIPSYKLRLTGEDESLALADDIIRFVEWKINKLTSTCQFPLSILGNLRKRLVDGADFTFLWVSLIVTSIEDTIIGGISMAELETILNTSGLDDVYRRLLEIALKANVTKTRKLLCIILAAVRPLTIEEMCVAVEIRETEDSIRYVDEKNRQSSFPQHWQKQQPTAAQSLETLNQQLHRPFDNHVRQLCGHFVRIRRRRLYFVHQTARSFLMKETLSFYSDPRSQRGLSSGFSGPGHSLQPEGSHLTPDNTLMWRPIEPDEANMLLLRLCVTYIRMLEPHTNGEELPILNKTQVEQHFLVCKNDPPGAFFAYAAINWIHHYRPVRRLLSSRYDHLLIPKTPLFNAWVIVHSSWSQEHDPSRVPSGAICLDNRGVEGRSKQYASSSYQKMEYGFEMLSARLKGLKDDIDLECYRYQPDSNGLLQTLQELTDRMKLIEGLIKTPIEQGPAWFDWKPLEQHLSQLQTLAENLGLSFGYEGIKIVFNEIRQFGQQEIAENRAEREKMLNEALLHFDLLDLDEAGLEEDEVLSEYWKSRIDEKTLQQYDDSKYGNPEDYLETTMPNRIKHYIRVKAGMATDMKHAVGTPGATHPGLSNPEHRFSSFGKEPMFKEFSRDY